MGLIDIKNVRVSVITVVVMLAFVVIHTVVVYAGVGRMIDVAIAKHAQHPHAQSLTAKDAKVLMGEIQGLRRDIDRLEKRLDRE